MVRITGSDIPRVFTDGERLYTVNSVPGEAVYGERLVREDGVEYREWDARRSKLAAFLKKGAAMFPFDKSSDVLYLGAAQGTTVSHVADVCAEGTVYAVEISRRAFQKLLDVSSRRPNVMPILGDAAHPETYARLLGPVRVLYQDVAQRDQVGIFLKNLPSVTLGGFGILIIKARSSDVTAKPRTVYRAAVDRLAGAGGLEVVQLLELDPFHEDHAAILVERTR